MELLVAIILGLILGLYFYKREAPMTVKSWIKGLIIILICVIITDGFLHIDNIKQGVIQGNKEMDIHKL